VSGSPAVRNAAMRLPDWKNATVRRRGGNWHCFVSRVRSKLVRQNLPSIQKSLVSNCLIQRGDDIDFQK
jgi:hypothetical protein